MGVEKIKISIGKDVMEITLDVLKKLPQGKPLLIEEIIDKNGNKVTAIKWTWIDMSIGFPFLRTAHFDLLTGDCLGDA